MKDGVLQPGERSPQQIQRNIKRLERQYRAKGLAGEPSDKRSQLSAEQYEHYLILQISAADEKLGEMTATEFEEWLSEMSDEQFEKWQGDASDEQVAHWLEDPKED